LYCIVHTVSQSKGLCNLNQLSTDRSLKEIKVLNGVLPYFDVIQQSVCAELVQV